MWKLVTALSLVTSHAVAARMNPAPHDPTTKSTTPVFFVTPESGPVNITRVCDALREEDLMNCTSTWTRGASGFSRGSHDRIRALLRLESPGNTSWTVAPDAAMDDTVYDYESDPTPRSFEGRFSFEQSIQLFDSSNTTTDNDRPELASTLTTPRRTFRGRDYRTNVAGGELRNGSSSTGSGDPLVTIPLENLNIAEDFSQGNRTSQTLVVQHDTTDLGALSVYAGGCSRRCRARNNFYFASPGSNVTVYIVDMPVSENVQFKQVQTGESRLDPSRFVDAQGAGGCSRDTGTYLAAAVGGFEFGTAKDVDLVSVGVKRCEEGSTRVSDVMAGLDWLETHYRENVAPEVAVALISLTVPAAEPASHILEDRIRSLTELGVVFSVAAGNHHDDACDYVPANMDEVLTVGGAKMASDALSAAPWAWTNFGTCVDLFAPCTKIVSASSGCYECTATLSSTAVAAARSAGVMAQYLETNARALPVDIKNSVLEASTVQYMQSPKFPYRTTTQRVLQSILTLNVFEVTSVV